jgi:hypothetical protein
MGVSATPYFTRVGEHLAASRRENPLMSFAGAWTRALKAHPCPGTIQGFSPDVMDFARRQFSTGYYRQSLGSAGLLAEDRGGYVSTIPPEATARRCGSGEGCQEDAREGGFLCLRHAEEIRGSRSHAAPWRSKQIASAAA